MSQISKRSQRPISQAVVGFIEKRRWLTLLLAVFAAAALMIGSGTIQQDFSHRVWFSDTDPNLASFDEFERRFGNDERLAVVVTDPQSVFRPEAVKVISDLTAVVQKTPLVVGVESLTNFQWVRSEDDEITFSPLLDAQNTDADTLKLMEQIALEHPVLPGFLVSSDGKSAMIFGRLAPSLTQNVEYQPLIDSLLPRVQPYLDRTDVKVSLSGGPILNNAFKTAGMKDLGTLFPLVLLVVALILGFTLRSTVAVILTFATAFLAILSTFGVMGFLGIKMTNMTTILPQTLLAISMATCVHILSAVKKNSQRMSSIDAIREALAKNLMPTLLTSITTAAGFLGFATSNVIPLRDLGYVSAAGSLLIFLFVYIFLAPLLFVLPQKKTKNVEKTAPTPTSPFAARLSRFIEARSSLVIGCSFVVLLGGSFLATRLEVNSNPFDYFPEESSIRQATDFIEAHVGGVWGPEIVIEAPQEGLTDPDFLRRVDQLQKHIEAKPYVSKVVSAVDIVKSVNKSLNGDAAEAYRIPDSAQSVAEALLLYEMSLPSGQDMNDRMAPDRGSMRLTALWTLREFNASMAAVEEFEAVAADLGLTVWTTGKNSLFQSMNAAVVQTFLESLLVAVGLISLILGLFFRSAKVALMAMVPNVIPLFIGSGLFALFGQSLDVGSVLVFAVCLGISVDDTVHFIFRYMSHRSDGLTTQDSLSAVFHDVSSTLALTTLIMVASFSVFIFAEFQPNVHFGTMSVLIFSLALAADLIVLPAILSFVSQRKERSQVLLGAKT